MATGFQTSTSAKYQTFRLVDGATGAGVAAPSAATSGVAIEGWSPKLLQTDTFFLAVTDRSGTGTLGFTYAKLWGYIADLNKWFPVGTGADADRGKLNDAAAVGEVAADDLRLIEITANVGLFDRLAVEINTVTGTNPVIDVDLLIPRHFGRRSA